jgi:hypothetical protein
MVETCANCGERVGAMEQPFVWNDRPVCRRCHRRLTADSNGAGRRPRATVIAAAGALVLLVGIVVVVVMRRPGAAADGGGGRAAALDSRTVRIVNLLGGLDPGAAAVEGLWGFRNGELHSDGSPWCRIELPYEPPAEYDFTVEFARKSGGDSVVQVATQEGRPFAWSMGFWNDSALAIEGKGAPEPVRIDGAIGQGVRHTSTLKVRRDGVQAWLDGRMLVEWKTNFEDSSLQEGWRLRSANRLGLGGFSPAVFYRADVTEVSGREEEKR